MLRRIFVALLAILVVGGAAVWHWRMTLLMPLPGMIDRLRAPIGPTRAVAWQPGPAPAGQRPPNVVVILADDLGYNDLTFGGGGVANGAVPTPRIDSIARDGVEFTHGYAGNATCAPSRAAIMTGRYPTRFGFEFTPAPKQFMRLVSYLQRNDPIPSTYFADREAEVPPIQQQGLPAQEITVAHLLQDHGHR